MKRLQKQIPKQLKTPFGMLFLLILISIPFLLNNCIKMKPADSLIYNARIYTVDSLFSVSEAMMLKDGSILAVGTEKELRRKYKPAEEFDMDGKNIYPGFIDAHCHFTGYGLSLNQVELSGTSSPMELLQKVKDFALQNPQGWITGRGWDQNDWEKQEFPDRSLLDTVFPDRPVVLFRIDGHAALANAKALEIAGITNLSTINGGEFRKRNNRLTGILVDNAIEEVRKHIPLPSAEEMKNGLLKAQENCFAVGLTSVQDAGLDAATIKLIGKLQKEESLKMRIYAMLNPDETSINEIMKAGILKTEKLNVRSLKLYADGALGSRGALLIRDYSDSPGSRGLFVTPPEELKRLSQLAFENGYQVCIHCIGDSAVRTVLELYTSILKDTNDLRWRIEHAQVIDPADVEKFGKFNIVPSVQTTHATSDMYWAEKRLGARIHNAYMYRTLLMQNGWLPNGSDFPVENINPILGFYAAVARKDLSGFPEEGFMKEQSLTREDALKAMTIWAARAAFEEDEKGSLETGKLADFVVLDRDIMEVPENSIHQARVLSTWVSGSRVFQLKE